MSNLEQETKDYAIFLVAENERIIKKLQAICPHNFGRTRNAESNNVCSYCDWDLNKCQHKGQSGNYCAECGVKLRSK